MKRTEAHTNILPLAHGDISRHSPEQAAGAASTAIRWCAVGHAETSKCDAWSINSVTDDGTSTIECQNGGSVEECLKKIMVKQSWLKWGNVTNFVAPFCDIYF